MTFEQFITRIYPIVEHWLTNKPEDYYDPWTKVNNIHEVIRESRIEGRRQCVGGTRGGSCWDDSNSQIEEYTTNEHDSIEITCLEDILTELCPTITFLQYKRLERAMNTQIVETSEHEYYGNSSNYQQMVITMGDLYDALIKIGVI